MVLCPLVRIILIMYFIGVDLKFCFLLGSSMLLGNRITLTHSVSINVVYVILILKIHLKSS